MPKHDRYTQEEVNFRMTCRQILHETQDALSQHNTMEIHFSHWISSLDFPKNFASNAVRSLKLVHDSKFPKKVAEALHLTGEDDIYHPIVEHLPVS
jgi:hypothetical protein